jgi:hypothetical protein
MSTTPQRIAAGGGWSLGAAESAYVVVKQRITAGRYRSGERLAIDLLRAELRVSKIEWNRRFSAR